MATPINYPIDFESTAARIARPPGLDVSTLVDLLQIGQSAMSHGLSMLLHASIADVRRWKKNRIYSLNASVQVAVQDDRLQLQLICWSGEKLNLETTVTGPTP